MVSGLVGRTVILTLCGPALLVIRIGTSGLTDILYQCD
jgi:hypothetical protein